MLTEEQFKEIKNELDDCDRPLFFFDDDPDGLTAFLLLYRYKQAGKGIPVKTSPKLTAAFIDKVNEFSPDKIFVLDTPIIEEEFRDQVHVPIIWIDHHGPADTRGVSYFNPRTTMPDVNQPTSYLCYQVVNQDMWIAAIGCVGDWFFPPFANKLREKYPDILPAEIIKPEDSLFHSQLGELVMIISYILKGKISEVMKCVKILTRIKHPDEILKQSTPAGKYIYQRGDKIKKVYKELLSKALESEQGKDLIVFRYTHDKFSFTKELANEILYKNPFKKLIIGREKDDEIKCSIRGSQLNLKPAVEFALQGVNGYGGGHEHACGACIKVQDFNKFVDQFNEYISKLPDGN